MGASRRRTSVKSASPRETETRRAPGKRPKRGLGTTGVFTCLALALAAAPAHAQTERDALMSLYRATGGPTWNSNVNWGTEQPVGEWAGVGTTADGRVVYLNLDDNGLTGSVPPEVGWLTDLTSLDLASNQLTGIPAALGRLANLENLSLSDNELTEIPAALGGLASLRFLNLSANRLKEIPATLGRLVDLRFLNLSSNELTEILFAPGEWRGLSRLDLSSNGLTRIPAFLGALADLDSLNLSANRLAGNIPREVLELDLDRLDLSSNQLSGGIPAGLADRTEWLDLSSNELTGAVPAELGRASIRFLDLSDNALTGSIPASLGRLSIEAANGFGRLDLSHNRLSGPIPPELASFPWVCTGYCQDVVPYDPVLDLSHNQLTGSIPVEILDNWRIGGLDLSHNQLTGRIPSDLSISNWPAPARLDLSHNRLNGPIPADLMDGVCLSVLDLSHNRLSGPIPPELTVNGCHGGYHESDGGGLGGSSLSLRHLDLSHNELSGDIPEELAQLANLERLHIVHNALTGPVPPAIAAMPLFELDLTGYGPMAAAEGYGPAEAADPADAPAAVSRSTGRRVALVIGNSAYRTADYLRNPMNDAEDVGDALERVGFDVTVLLDGTRADMVEAVQSFEERGAGAEASLVFYAGHGVEMDGRNYLVPVDARLARDTHVRDETVSLDRVLSAMEPARVRIAILDACRDNPWASTMLRRTMTRLSSGGLAEVGMGLSGLLVAYATAPRTVAGDGTGRNSPYTEALLAHLERPNVEVGLMFREVEQQVIEATAGLELPQRPWTTTSGLPAFYMNGR